MAIVGVRQQDEIASRFVLRAAGLAPSVHNTQPWYFTSRQGVIRLYADQARLLLEEDPAGRELVISCGAALCNLVLAVRHLGFAADVLTQPDASRADLLAEVRWGRYAPPSPYEDRLFQSIPRRHTHRGPFAAQPPESLEAELVQAARHEHADLCICYDGERQSDLARLVELAERAQSEDPKVAAERARWARFAGDSRADGVPVAGYPCRWDGPAFTARRLVPRAAVGFAAMFSPSDPRQAGLIALLTTRYDRLPNWLAAGQALQRLLLHAQARGVEAAFHTQPLEVAELRKQVRTGFTQGAFPQVLLRLGRDGYAVHSPRRTVSETLRDAADISTGGEQDGPTRNPRRGHRGPSHGARA